MQQSIERYLNVRQAYCPAFLGADDMIAFLTDITGVPQVWSVNIQTNQGLPLWPDQRTFSNDRVQGIWTSAVADDRRLIYARDLGGNENAQLYLLDLQTGTETPLTAGYDSAMHTFGAWSSDGTQILFAANRRNPAIFDLYLQSLDSTPRLIWQNDGPGYLFSSTFAPDGRHAAVVRVRSGFDHDLFEIDLETGEARQLIPQDEAVRYEALAYAADGQCLYINTDQGSDFLYIGRLDLATQRMEPLITTARDIDAMACSPDRRLLAYSINEDGMGKLEVLDTQTGARRSAPTLGPVAGVIGMLDARLQFAPNSQRLTFSYTSATQASNVFIWDLAGDAVQPVTRSAHGGLATSDFVAPELIRYPTFDERTIPAWFYRPAGQTDEQVPAVVIVHGGPEGQFQPYFHFLVQYLTAQGYAVLAPNVRGSTGYGKAYSHLDDVEKRMDSVADLAYAARWLKQRADIDGERLAVYGGSYGGFMVLATLTTDPELWAAGVEIVGIGNLATFLENTSAYRRASREAEYGSLEHDREFLESIAPINHLDRLTAPLMILHGENDPRVPVSEARDLAEKLRQRGVTVDMHIFDDEGHGIVKLKNKLVAYPAIVQFLNSHLGSQREGNHG